MPAFVLPLIDIDENGKRFRFTVDASWLRESLADTGLRPTADATPGSIDVTAQRSGTEILLRGRLLAKVACDCARCLEDALVEVDADLTTLLMPEAERPRHVAVAADDEDDLSDDAVVREYFSGDEIVLDPLIRELIVLEEPMQPLCSPDCAGIPIPEGVKPPADFGREAGAVDPRFAPLSQLQAKLKRE